MSRTPEALLPALTTYAQMLADWQGRMNLVAPSTIPHLWERHFEDSLQLVPLIEKLGPKNLADLGSGAGFPGMCIALALPEVHVTLIESITKKCTFLEAVKEALQLKNVTVLNGRAESAPRRRFEVVTARAVASIDVLLGLAYPLLTQPGTALFLKGKTYEVELAAAQPRWRFDCVAHPSVTSAEGRVLELTAIARRPDDTPNRRTKTL